MVFHSAEASEKDSTKTFNGSDMLDQIFMNKEKAEAAFKHLTETCRNKTPTLKDARTAFYKDMCKFLDDMGLTAQPFLSMDRDEVFMRVSLDHPDAESFYAEEYYLQMQMSPDVLKAMNVKYVPEPRDPSIFLPFMPYSKDIEEDKAGELGMDYLFRRYKLRNPNGSILKMVDRIHAIQLILAEVLDMDDTIQHGLMKDFFPVHAKQTCWELRAEWANLRFMTLLNLCRKQPLDRIRNYFGAEIAFRFAWIGETIRRLVVLAVASVLYEVLYMFKVVDDFYLLLSWAGIMVIWGAYYIKDWTREEQYLATKWNGSNLLGNRRIRANFRGTMEPSPLNANERKRFFPQWKVVLAKIFSTIVFLIFSAAACAAIGVLQEKRQEAINVLGSYGASAISIGITVSILILNALWSVVAQGLVWLENPESMNQYAESMIHKKFAFQFIGSYNAFIYIAFVQRARGDVDPCPNDDCIGLLSSSLIQTYASLAASILVSMVIPFVKLWWKMRQETERARKVAADRGETFDENSFKAYMEQQAKMDNYSVDDDINDMLSLVISVGYVLLFGGVCPAVVLIALVVFMVQLRATAWRFCRVTKRPFPVDAASLGAWDSILSTLSWLGMLASVTIPLLNTHHFQRFDEEYKVLLFFGAEHVFICLRLLVSFSIPDISNQSRMIRLRRQYILNRLLAGKIEKKKDSTNFLDRIVTGLSRSRSVERFQIESLELLAKQADWDKVEKIPFLSLCGQSNEDGVPDISELSHDREDKV